MNEPFKIKMLSTISEVSAEDWDRLANPEGEPFDPFLSHAFFFALEESGSAVAETGWEPVHLVARDQLGKICGILPLFIKGHSAGEYVFDHGWAQGFEMAGGQYYPKMLSAVPFTPVTGRRIFATGPRAKQIEAGLVKTAIELLRKKRFSSLHFNFLEPTQADLLEDHNFLLRHDTQFHWVDMGYGDFEGFLASLQSRKRKALKKERRAALEAGLEIKWIEGDEISAAHWDVFYNFYLDTGNRKWGTPYLTREFFDIIGERLSDHIVLMFAYNQQGKAIAGALNLKGSDTLYGRYWGSLEYHPYLHFEICYYQAIDYALANGLKRVEAGAQGEHKLLRGYAPQDTISAHYIAHPGFKAAVAAFLKDETQQVEFRTELLSTHLPYRIDDKLKGGEEE